MRNTSWHSRINTRRNTLAKHSARYNYIIAAQNEPTHYAYLKKPDVDIFIPDNVTQQHTATTETAMNSDHQPIRLQLENWNESMNTSTQTQNQLGTIWKRNHTNQQNNANHLQEETSLITTEIQIAYTNNTRTTSTTFVKYPSK